MKHFTYIVLLSILSSIANAQPINKDTTISFQVSGVCVQCKHRIEKSLKIKGVESSEWNVNTHLISIHYNPQIISTDQLHKTIAAAGHDTEKEKATDEA